MPDGLIPADVDVTQTNDKNGHVEKGNYQKLHG